MRNCEVIDLRPLSEGLWYEATFSTDGEVLALARRSDGKLWVSAYLTQSGELLGQLPPQSTYYNGLLISRDRLMCWWDAKGLICGWSLSANQEQWRFSAYHWAVDHEPQGRRTKLLQSCRNFLVSDGNCWVVVSE